MDKRQDHTQRGRTVCGRGVILQTVGFQHQAILARVGAADALRSLSYGEAAAVQINSSTLLLMVRVDPLSVSSLDDLRSQILSDMKGGELDDALAAGGAELAHDLDSSAMNKLPAKKIVNNSANS